MTAEKALAEAVAYLQGVGSSINPAGGAALITEQLAARGFCVQPISAPVLYDLAPETLRRVRKALGVTLAQLADEAGLKPHTIGVAERSGTQTRTTTLRAIADGLVRLGARRPEYSRP